MSRTESPSTAFPPSVKPPTQRLRRSYILTFNEEIGHMPQSEFLGEFEQIVLLIVARLEGGAYGMAIRQDIEERTSQDVAIGSVYSALDRMEKKGLVASEVGDPTPERGGRAKRYYRLRRPGVLALTRSHETHAKLWEGLELDQEAYGR